MKKKVLKAILPVCAAVAMTACGGNAGTKEVEEAVITEESSEADALEEAEAETPTADKEDAESEQAEKEPVDEEPAEKVAEPEFLSLDDYAVGQDKSAEFGVYSKSSEDVYQFLNEDSSTQWQNDYEAKENEEYSGRFAYPVPIQGDVFENAIIWERTDSAEVIRFWDDGSEEVKGLTIEPGHAMYNGYMTQIEYNGDSYSIPFTITIGDDTVDVVRSKLVSHMYTEEVDFNEDGEAVNADGEVVEAEERTLYMYLCKFGGFTVSRSTDGVEVSQEEFQSYIDNLKLVDGTDETGDAGEEGVTSDTDGSGTEEVPEEPAE